MKRYTLKELAELTGSTLVGDPGHVITGVDSLESAGPHDASFLANSKYSAQLEKTQAGVVCVSSTAESTGRINLLICQDPSSTFQRLLDTFLADNRVLTGFTGIHPTAVIHPTATIGKDVHIGPYVVIDAQVTIGDHSSIGAHTYIGPRTHLGSSCLLHPRVTIREGCHLGHRVVIQPGAVIGSCGFGFHTNAQGEHSKLEQLGTVEIEDDVEIGANTAIDRARFKATRIGKGSKIDNLVQIGHNVEIGTHNLIVSQVGVAGSVKTGRNVVLGGQVGVAGHLKITDFVMIGAKSGISKSIEKPGKYAGVPVMPLTEYNKQQVLLRDITTFVKQLKELSQRLSS
jgi:UDP-3-O-[3-hydroxymyristoyl] glucosamine N-acyltransferase